MQVTPLTVLVWKLNANGLFAMSIMSQAPSFTLATCRARDLLLPVDEELAVVNPFSFGGPLRHWAKQLDLIVLSTPHQRFGIHLSTVNHMKLRKHLMLCELIMNILHDFPIWSLRW